jgi:hypothetical protein
MTAPLASSAEGVEAVERVLAEHVLQYGPAIGQICSCGHSPSWASPDLLLTQQDIHRAHVAAALIASGAVQDRREVAAEVLEAAARDLPGLDHIRTHGDAARWLRDRAAELRATTPEAT